MKIIETYHPPLNITFDKFEDLYTYTYEGFANVFYRVKIPKEKIALYIIYINEIIGNFEDSIKLVNNYTYIHSSKLNTNS